MDIPQTPLSPQVPEEPSKSSFSFRVLFIYFALVLFGVLIGILVSSFLPTSKTTVTPSFPTSAVTPTSTFSPELTAEQDATLDPTANWKTYNGSDFSYKYPSLWKEGQGGQTIVSDMAGVNITNFTKDMPMYNECMKLDKTETKNGLMMKYYSYASNGEMCSNQANINNKETWITKANGDGFQPGLIYHYNEIIYSDSAKLFNQILSTFKFTGVITPTTTLTPTISLIPSGWTKREFPTVGLNLYAPIDWKSEIQYFSNVPSNLIRFWQGNTPDTATVQLNIKNNWDNMSGQYEDRNFQINDSLYATKVDPPKMNEQTLDRYQTNYTFEKDSKVYFLGCVHNWIDVNYKMCETLLKTMEFTK